MSRYILEGISIGNSILCTAIGPGVLAFIAISNLHIT